jgi:hypothetical protein
MTTTSDDPSSSSLCVVCIGYFPRGVPGGDRYSPHPPPPPSGYVQHPKICFGRFLLFLADFAIFSGLLKIIPVLGIKVLVSTKYLKTLYILYSEW